MGSNGPSWGRRYGLQKYALAYWRDKQREADEAACKYWNLRMGERGPAQPSPTIGQALHGGFRFLRVGCNGCKQRAWIDLAEVRRPRKTPVWTLEGSLACQRCQINKIFRPKTTIERLTREHGTLGWPLLESAPDDHL